MEVGCDTVAFDPKKSKPSIPSRQMGLDVHNGLQCSKSMHQLSHVSFLRKERISPNALHRITSSTANTVNELLAPSGLLGASGQGSCGYASDGQGCSLASRSLRSSGSVISETPPNRPILCRTDTGSITNQTKGQGLKQSLGASTRSADADAVAPVVAWEESMRSQYKLGFLREDCCWQVLTRSWHHRTRQPRLQCCSTFTVGLWCPNWYVMGSQPAAAAIDRELEAILDAPDTSPGPGSSGIAFKLPHNAMW